MKALKISSTLHARLPVRVEIQGGGDGLVVGIPGEVTVLSAKSKPHLELARLRDIAVQGFVKRWGPPLPPKDCYIRGYDQQPMFVGDTYNLIQKLLKDHPGTTTFFQYSKRFLISRRDLLRKAWLGDISAVESLKQHVASNAGSGWSFKNGGIEVEVPDLWTLVCILFLNDRGRHRIGVCEWPDCSMPYFVKSRRDQKFCGGTCIDEARKEIKRNWWNRNYGVKRRKR